MVEKRAVVEKTVVEKEKTAEKKAARKQTRAKRREIYYANKMRILQGEPRNYVAVAVIRGEDASWYKMFGHSAVIYSTIICPALSQTAALRPDGDPKTKSKEGVVIIRSLKKLKDNMARYGAKITSENEEEIVFVLPQKISEDDYQRAAEQEEGRYAAANSLLLPTVVYPTLSKEIREMVREIYIRARIFPEADRRVIGNRVLETAQGIQEIFILMSMGEIPELEGLEKIIQEVDHLMGLLVTVLDLRIMRGTEMYTVSVLITRVKKRAQKIFKDASDRERDNSTK